MPKPLRAAIGNPAANAFLPHANPIAVAADGDSADANPAAARTSVCIRVFYRVNGIPIAQTLYNGPVNNNVGAGASKKFETIPGNVTPFQPAARVLHTVRMIAWDHIGKPNNGVDHRTRVTRFRIV